jgi:hypothetical protein
MKTERKTALSGEYAAVLRNRVLLWVGILILLLAVAIPTVLDFDKISSMTFSLIGFVVGLIAIAYVLAEALVRTSLHYWRLLRGARANSIRNKSSGSSQK